MPNFEWDDNKAASNKKKHKIGFDDATDVFNDDDRLKFASDKNGEVRYLTIGKAFEVIVSVIYTMRGLVVRIISARRANRDERRAYLTKKLSKTNEDER